MARFNEARRYSRSGIATNDSAIPRLTSGYNCPMIFLVADSTNTSLVLMEPAITFLLPVCCRQTERET
ncbi:MAG: hypothetical protein DSY87_03220 [Methylococcus sp.]|nr:MAG: hypothetical protein DSY87_03220 [Methylococcus sp.]